MILVFKICNDRCTANGHIKGRGGEKSSLFRPMIDSNLRTSVEVVTAQQIRNRAGMLLVNKECYLLNFLTNLSNMMNIFCYEKIHKK